MDENLKNITISSKPYIAPKSAGKSELSVKKSVFISYAAPVKSPEEATNFLSEIKGKYPDARHHVYAWSISGEVFREKYSDDHEPSGTAGLPISTILSSNNISNVIVVVVRYFGGTLLGTGGLVRAYTNAATDALNKSDLRLMEENTIYSLTTDYGDFEKIKRHCVEKSHLVSDEKYTENISFKISVSSAKKELFLTEISDITNGQVSLKELGTKYLPGEKRIFI